MVDFNYRSAQDIIYESQGIDIEKKLNVVSETTPLGNLSNAIGRAFRGINHRGMPGLIPINKDYHGLTFFTRPELNLSDDNLRSDRIMRRLLSTNDFSMERVIRCYLDPRVQGKYQIPCPLVDNLQAFIPILTNTLTTISGWPDEIVQSNELEPGVYGETTGHADGPPRNYGAYDVTANFKNIIGDPVTQLAFYMQLYAKLVHEGLKMIPYPENMLEHRVDYNIRIYRLVLDETKTYVTNIGACGASHILSSPTGAKFNYDAEKDLNDSNDQVSIPFRCYGFISYDDILIDQFNGVVSRFNPGMREDSLLAGSYIKVGIGALPMFNNYGYPRIDPYTRELQWWVSKEVFDYFLPGMSP